MQKSDINALENCLQAWRIGDPSSVISGDNFVFDDFSPKEDDINQSLFTKSIHDDTVCEVLKLLFGAFYRNGGRSLSTWWEIRMMILEIAFLWKPSLFQKQILWVNGTSREKPNATILWLEALILFRLLNGWIKKNLQCMLNYWKMPENVD